MSEKLPSLDDFTESELPSVEEFLKEEETVELPSVEEFIEEEKEEEIKEEENVTIIDDAQGNPKIEVTDIIQAPQWGELVRMVNDVRESIPDIPEIKCYDNELKELSDHLEELKESIPEVPEVKYYDTEVETICEQIDLVREEVKNLPEVKYYDEQLNTIEEKIRNLPEPKYYDGEIEAICEAIDSVKEQIPTFPKWVNEVNEVPDFSWIGKTFSVIDDDFIKVGDNIKDLRDRFDADFHDLSESLDTKDFEKRVQIDEVKADIKETNERIFKELKEAAIKIWAHHDQFKDDDRKLKKQVLSKLNETKQKIEEKILDSRTKSYEENKTLSKYFEGLQKEIASLPEVKYYDNPIRDLKKEVSRLDEKVVTKLDDTTLNIAELYKLVGEIKATQQQLHEGILDASPDEKIKEATDKFVTVQDLQRNYKLFVQNVQQQMAAWGDGGEVNLQYMDDITGIATNISAYDGMFLTIDTSQSGAETGKKFKFASVSAGSTAWEINSTGIVTTSSVGIGTTNAATELYVKGDATITGDLNITGDIVYDEQTARNLNVTGIATIHTLGVTSTTTTQDLAVGAGATVTGALTVSGTTALIGVTTVGILTSYESISIGSTNLFTEIEGKTSIGLVLALS